MKPLPATRSNVRAVEKPERRIEITLRLWKAGSARELERYIKRLLKLLPRHRGRLERRAREVEAGPERPDAVLVLSFPDGSAVEDFLRDPRRDDFDDLASRALARSLITGAKIHDVQEHDPIEVVHLSQEQRTSTDTASPDPQE